jgi:hypothetical protein
MERRTDEHERRSKLVKNHIPKAHTYLSQLLPNVLWIILFGNSIAERKGLSGKMGDRQSRDQNNHQYKEDSHAGSKTSTSGLLAPGWVLFFGDERGCFFSFLLLSFSDFGHVSSN